MLWLHLEGPEHFSKYKRKNNHYTQELEYKKTVVYWRLFEDRVKKISDELEDRYNKVSEGGWLV